MVSHSSDCLKIVSYNCRGWKSGSNYVKSILQYCDLCLIQEHWLFRENLDSLLISNDFLSVSVSGMDSSQLLSGRPFGGCCIMYRKALSAAVRRIFTNSNRLCAVSISLNNVSTNSSFVVLICVYLPTDYSNAASQSAFSESLREVLFQLSILMMSLLLVILMLIFHVLGQTALIYPHSCQRTISFLLINCLISTIPIIKMTTPVFPRLTMFSRPPTMYISLTMSLLMILLKISLITSRYISL